MNYDESKYKEAIERAKKSLETAKTFDYKEEQIAHDIRETVYFIFPELKEGEDERIKRNIIAALKGEGYYDCDLTNECIAWVKKQGEQKPVDKIEPKFKVGDWVTNGFDCTFQIASIENGIYYDTNDCGSDIESTDKYYHLWTIEDAKDGDVLVSSNSIFIFNREYAAGKPEACCGIINDEFIDNAEGCWTNEKYYPATKEQRDFLFAKMRDAGYEWDDNKKEPKKIGQKSVDKMIKPKFKVGDYIKHNKANIICKITYVNSGSYFMKNIETNSETELFNAEQNFHLWTIEDAKDGDVLASGQVVFIFKMIHGVWLNCYCSSHNDGTFIADSYDLMKDKYFSEVQPATKEERDFLFAKMRDAGYEWDDNKKEPKKIARRIKEDETNKLSEEDIKNLNRISTILYEAGQVQCWWKEKRLIPKEESDYLCNWLKSLYNNKLKL